MRVLLFIVMLLLSTRSIAQDTALYKGMTVNLDEVVVNAKRIGFDVNSFIKRVEEDTTFYRAFKNLHLVQYVCDNDIRFFDKKGGIQASLKSQTMQTVQGRCHSMKVLQETSTGDFYTKKGNYNYYTAELYASLFFTKGTICVDAADDVPENAGGSMARHKSQLKELIFNPGHPVKGAPIVGGKVAIFDPEIRRFYNFSITSEDYLGVSCYVFSAVAKKDLNSIDRGDVVINELVTYFNKDNFEIVGRRYSLSYKTLMFDFDVRMNVQMTKQQGLLIPALVTYDGTWDIPFKKRETSVFIAKFHDFK